MTAGRSLGSIRAVRLIVCGMAVACQRTRAYPPAYDWLLTRRTPDEIARCRTALDLLVDRTVQAISPDRERAP